MTVKERETGIERGSILVGVVLGAAALVGFGLGTWLGQHQPGAPGQAIIATAPTPSPLPSTSLSPTAAPSPTAVEPSPTASTPSASTPSATVTEPPISAAILEIEGTGNHMSKPFEAVAGWQIQWQIDGATLRIAVTGDQDLGTIVDQPGPASGVTSLAPNGTFRLEVTAKGPWSIRAVQGGS